MSVVAELVEKIEKLTLLEAVELKKALEEKFGVTAAAPMMMAAAPAAGVPHAAAGSHRPRIDEAGERRHRCLDGVVRFGRAERLRHHAVRRRGRRDPGRRGHARTLPGGRRVPAPRGTTPRPASPRPDPTPCPPPARGWPRWGTIRTLERGRCAGPCRNMSRVRFRWNCSAASSRMAPNCLKKQRRRKRSLRKPGPMLM